MNHCCLEESTHQNHQINNLEVTFPTLEKHMSSKSHNIKKMQWIFTSCQRTAAYRPPRDGPPQPPLPPLCGGPPRPLPRAACILRIPDLPLPAAPGLACFPALNIGAFFNMSGRMRNLILEPRM